MVYWITGRADAGKTTKAHSIAIELTKSKTPCCILDGDVERLLTPAGFDDKSRFRHIMRIAVKAAYMERAGIVPIIALVSPKKVWREKARKLFEKSKLIYMPDGYLWENTTYEEPDEEELNHE